ncbi:hypothetical protein HK096_009360, partial [Nowakowskiella sp. JEL0078]
MKMALTSDILFQQVRQLLSVHYFVVKFSIHVQQLKPCCVDCQRWVTSYNFASTKNFATFANIDHKLPFSNLALKIEDLISLTNTFSNQPSDFSVDSLNKILQYLLHPLQQSFLILVSSSNIPLSGQKSPLETFLLSFVKSLELFSLISTRFNVCSLAEILKDEQRIRFLTLSTHLSEKFMSLETKNQLDRRAYFESIAALINQCFRLLLTNYSRSENDSNYIDRPIVKSRYTKLISIKLAPFLISGLLEFLTFSLDLSNNEKTLNINEKLAIETLAMLQIVLNSNVIIENQQFSLMSMPGISSSLTKCIKKSQSFSLNHKIIVNSLGCLQTIFNSALSGSIQLDTSQPSSIFVSALTSNSKILNKPIPAQDAQTAFKIHMIISHISLVRQHGNPNVRIALLQFCSSLLIQCCQNPLLSTSINLLLESLILFLADDFPQITESCSSQLTILSNTITEFSFWDNMRNNLFNFLTTTLPANLRATTPTKQQLETVNLTVGYLTLLSTHTQAVLDLPDALPMILTHILALVEPASTTHLVLDTTAYGFPLPRLAHVHDTRVVAGLAQIVRLLAANGAADKVVDFAITHIDVSPGAALFVLARVVESGGGGLRMLREILELAMDDTLEAKEEALILKMECVAAVACACVPGTTLATDILTDGLGGLLLRMMDPRPAVREAAAVALNVMAKVFGLSGVRELVCENADYVLSSIDVRVLRAVVEVVEKRDILLFVGPVVDDLLGRVDEIYVEGDVEIVDYVELICAIAKKVGGGIVKYPEEIKIVDTQKLYITPEITEFCEWYILRKSEVNEGERVNRAERFFSGEELSSEDFSANLPKVGEIASEPVEIKELEDPAITLALKIAKHAVPLLSHTSPVILVRLLQMYTAIIPSFIDKLKHPLIHSLWNTLLNRLCDNDFRVRSSALNLLRVIVISKDFIRRRAKDVVDIVIRKLEKNWMEEKEVEEWISVLMTIVNVSPVAVLKQNRLQNVLKKVNARSVKSSDILQVVSGVDEDWAWVLSHQGSNTEHLQLPNSSYNWS